MGKFDHPNVLTLRGVCLDGGPAPYIIMPFMANGSLLTYLKNNRKCLVFSSRSEDDKDVSLLNILHDIATRASIVCPHPCPLDSLYYSLECKNDYYIDI